MCEYVPICKKPSIFYVNAPKREAQVGACGTHVAKAIRHMEVFDDPRYLKRYWNNVQVFTSKPKKYS